MLESHDSRIHQILWAENIKKSDPKSKQSKDGAHRPVAGGGGGGGGGGIAGDDSPEGVQESNEDKEDEEDEDGVVTSGISARREPLAVILVNALLHMLFLPDFTIEDPNVDFGEEDINTKEFKQALMWASGVGSFEKSVTLSTAYDNNRIEVLRVMLSAFCDPLFRPPAKFEPCASLWLEVATSSEAPYAEIVLYSLMNTVLGHDPVGWGMPYGNLVSTDTAQPLMEVSVQVLVVLLDYGYPCRHGKGGKDGKDKDGSMRSVNPEDTESPGFNVYRRVLGTIDDPAQLNFIFSGFVRLLNNIPQSDRSYLPFSHSRVTAEQELLVLLWKCLEEIPKFLPYILKSCDVTELLVPLCYFMLEGRRDPARAGFVYLCTFIILKLSGERNFGVALNKAYTLELPVDIPLFAGTHADLLIVMLNKLVMDGHEKLASLHNCFTTIICNVSPYCKSLNSATSVKLCNLLSYFAAPHHMFAADGNYIFVVMLLETLNNILQYQYQGNVHVVYSVLRLKSLFEGLAALDLRGAAAAAAELQHKLGKEGEEPAAAPVLMDLRALKRDSEGDSPTNAPGSPVREANAAAPTHWGPDQAWIDRVRAELPLGTIMRLLKHLSPQVDELITSGGNSHEHVLAFIRETTMVGLLPVPHPIVIRKYQPNQYTVLWFSSFLWGTIFVRTRSPPLFDGKAIKLFSVQGE